MARLANFMHDLATFAAGALAIQEHYLWTFVALCVSGALAVMRDRLRVL